MFCTNCGKQLPDGAKFCSGCGTPVNAPAPPQEPEPPAGPFQIPQAGFPQTEETVPEETVPVEPFPVEEAPEAAVPQEVIPEEAAPTEEAPAEGNSEAWPPEEVILQKTAPVEDPPASAPEQPTFGGDAAPSFTAAAVAADPPKRRGKAGLVVLGVGAVVVILLVVLLVKLLSGLGGGGKAAFAYLNEDGELMYLADLKEKTEALELTDEADGYAADVRFSPDGKTVYFTDSDSSLYQIAVSELKKGGRPQRISRDVGSFLLLDDGRLLYSEYGGESKLSLYDGKESFRVIRGYSEYRISQDQKSLYYTEQDETGSTLSLYKIALTKDAREERLLKGAGSILTSYDAGLLVYTVIDDDSGSGNNVTVYSCTPGGDKTKLVSGVYTVTGVKSEGGKADFYYYVVDVEERTLYDFVTDARARDDASTLSEEEPEYPYSFKYSPSDYNILDDTTVEYYTEIDGWHPLDVSELLSEEYPTAYELYRYTYSIEALAREDAQVRYDAAMADYDQRSETWYAAQEREELRQSLKEEQYDQTSYSLYHYTGEAGGDPIATQLRSVASSAPFDGVFLYRKAELESGKVADVADLDYAWEVQDLLNSGSGDGPWYQNVGGKESELDLDDASNIYDVYVLDGKEAVLDVYDGDEETLMAFSLGSDALTFTSTIVDDDFSGPYRGQSSGKDALYLFTDVTSDQDYNTSGDFCVYQNGKLETIAQEVYGAAVLDNSGDTYLITDFETRNGSTELSLLKDGKPSAITDEMDGEPTFLDGGQVLYIADGDLMLWDSKESRRIARDVEQFWSSVSQSYSVYSA